MSAVEDVIDRSMGDEEFLEAFRDDPDAALAEYDLTEEERADLKSRLEGRIRDQVEDRRTNTVFTVTT